MTIFVDVEDLFDYARGNPRPSGIQRLAFQIQRELWVSLRDTNELRFVRHAGRDNQPLLWEVPWATIDALFGQLARSAPEPPARASELSRGDSWFRQARRLFGQLALRMPGPMREPLLQSWSFQREALQQFKELQRVMRIRPRKTNVPEAASAESTEAAMSAGDVFLVLGAPWVYADFAGLLSALRNRHSVRPALLLYDLIPLLRPEWCARDLVARFSPWLKEALPLCDSLMAISNYTATQVEQWAARAGVRLNGPVRPVPIGTGFGGEPAQVGATLGLPRPGSYVLFVSTLEARKNHALLVRVWRRLLEEEFAGKRPAGSVPELVFAGRVGWLVDDLMQQLENSSWLDGRVRLLRDPSDAELRALYEGALFSIFPSLCTRVGACR